MTAGEIAQLVASGLPYWWRGSDGNVYATENYGDDMPGDFLMLATKNWIKQWGGDWQAASDELAAINQG